MVDMWMLSVAAALVDPVRETDPPALIQLEQAVRAVPELGNSLDALRAGAEADRRELAEALADRLKAAYDAGGEFAGKVETLWPDVLFGPKKTGTTNYIGGAVGGFVVQAGAIAGGLNLAGAPKQQAPVPERAASEASSPRRWFGLGRRDK
jgi:hypothetical protein